MPAVGIVVGPVNHPALFIPLVLAIKFDRIALGQGIDAGGQVDIVGHQHGLPGCEPDDEALMPPALVVVRQNGDNDALPLDLHIALPVLKGLLYRILVSGLFELGSAELMENIGIEHEDGVCSQAKSGDDEYLPHGVT